MLLSILIIFFICWTPRVLQGFSLGFMRWSGKSPDDFALNDKEMGKLSVMLRIFSFLNSTVNVFIYYITSK